MIGETTKPRLSVTNLVKRFGGARAVDGIDLNIAPGEVVGVVGPNGSGKSTLVNLIMHVERPNDGVIHIDQNSTRRLDLYQIARLGAHYSFQRTRLLPELSAAEHLEMALAERGVLKSLFARNWTSPGGRERTRDILKRLNIGHVSDQAAAELSFGQRQLLCLAMATLREAQLLLLDEPLAGLSGESIDIFAQYVREYAARGAAVLIVEHRLRSLTAMCSRFIVVDQGKIIADGAPDEVMNRANVLEAYFGKAPT